MKARYEKKLVADEKPTVVGSPLPPLNPEKFLRWYWKTVGKGTPPTVAEFALWHRMTTREAWKWLLSHAAWLRKQGRLGRLK